MLSNRSPLSQSLTFQRKHNLSFNGVLATLFENVVPRNFVCTPLSMFLFQTSFAHGSAWLLQKVHTKCFFWSCPVCNTYIYKVLQSTSTFIERRGYFLKRTWLPHSVVKIGTLCTWNIHAPNLKNKNYRSDMVWEVWSILLIWRHISLNDFPVGTVN